MVKIIANIVTEASAAYTAKQNAALATQFKLWNPRYSSESATFTADNVEAALGEATKAIGGRYNVRQFGAKGDGTTDDTAAIQDALNRAMGTLYFPPGTYKVSGTGGYILNLTRNLNIVGAGLRVATILATTTNATTSILNVAITNNWGLGSIVGWEMRGLTLQFSDAVGLHAVKVEQNTQGSAMFVGNIQSCRFVGQHANGGHGIWLDGWVYNSKIHLCNPTSVKISTHDGNMIEKCSITNSSIPAVTIDLKNVGVRNTIVRDNIILAHNEAIRIVDGSNVRVVNNQMEQPGASVSQLKAMAVVQGETMTCRNVVFRDNNFGGGMNLDKGLVIQNAFNTVVDANNFVASGITQAAGAEIEVTSAAKYTYISQSNFLTGQLTNNPRPGTAFRIKVNDAGEGTIGVKKSVAGANGWSAFTWHKDTSGIINQWAPVSGGTTTPGTVMAILPIGDRPSGDLMNLPVGTDAGAGVVSVSGTTGEVKVVSLPSSSGVTLPPFSCRSMCVVDD